MVNSSLYILDDNELIGQTITRYVSRRGLGAEHYTHASAFLESVNNAAPDVILLDLFLPDLDGVEVIKRLANLDCQSRLILVSGAEDKVLSSATRLAASLGLNVIGSLTKPFALRGLGKLLNIHNASSAAFQISRSIIDGPPLETLALAIKENALTAFCQPKVSADKGEILGFEILARWIHPDFGFVGPDYFIQLAEKNGLIKHLSLNLFKQSLIWFKSFSERFYQVNPARVTTQRLSLALNISATSLNDETLFDELVQLCTRYDVEPSDIMLEITETAAMCDPVNSLSMLIQLRMKGFSLSIDDFGTGFSSILQLVRMPFSEVKIDRGFVLNLTESKESRHVVKAVVDLAHSLNVSVTAEGVENKETAKILKAFGCDSLQGYYFGKPMPFSQASEEFLGGFDS